MVSNIINTGEVIGLCTEIVDSTNKQVLGLSGEIVLESRNMLTMRTSNGKVKSLSKDSILRMKLHNKDGACFISGSKLIGKPEDRVSLN